jgi:putative ABC transport system permease protein
MPRIEKAIDEMFRNSPQPTKTETEKQLEVDFISMLGNVKAFIFSICMAVVFAILLVSANSMAMSIRERTREVALLKTLGFTRQMVLSLLGESVILSLLGAMLGLLAAGCLFYSLVHTPQGGSFAFALKITPLTLLAVLLVAVLVGLFSAIIPAWRSSRLNIVEGLRHVG